MSFLLLVFMVILLVISFAKYRRLYQVIIVITFLIGGATAALVAGLIILDSNPAIVIFNSEMPRREFYHLIAALYGVNVLCSFLVIRNYRAYLKVNAEIAAKNA